MGNNPSTSLSTTAFNEQLARGTTITGGQSAGTSLGTRLANTQQLDKSASPGMVTILSGHGRFYLGQINGDTVLVEVQDAAEVATIMPGTTLLATET